jgi:predicted small metal-binding protein
VPTRLTPQQAFVLRAKDLNRIIPVHQEDEARSKMRALDCSDPAHSDPMHFSAENDADLMEQVKKHRDEYHTEITDQQIQETVSATAYDE